MIADGMSRSPVGAAEHLDVYTLGGDVPPTDLGALEQAARRGSSAAGWLAVVGFHRAPVSQEEAREGADMEADCKEVCGASLDQVSGDVMGARVLTLEEVV